MSHPPSNQVAFQHDQGPASRSRRALLRLGLGLSLTLTVQGTHQPAPALAAIAVQVAAPLIVRTDDCQTTVSVDVTLADVPAARRYLLYGDILESDTGTEDADFCCTLRAQYAFLSPGLTHHLTLMRQAMAVDLGLVRGMGPAGDETFSPELVELFARIWLRDLATDEVLGPWDSPQRIAVSRTLPGWMPPENLQSNPLMTPRGNVAATLTASTERSLPPLPCAP